jgi:hypothetical protein
MIAPSFSTFSFSALLILVTFRSTDRSNRAKTGSLAAVYLVSEEAGLF